MYFSERERVILQCFMEQGDGVSLESLKMTLQVSQRTVYRELNNLAASLNKFGIEIGRDRKQGYFLRYPKDFTAYDLKDILGPKQRQASWPFFDREIRQQHLACQLLLENPELTRQGLAEDYGVSPATIQTDLKAVGEALLNYDLHLVRDDKKNYLVRGWEAERRQMLSSLLSQNIDEYTFFHPNRQGGQNSQAFMALLEGEDLELVQQIFNRLNPTTFAKVTDNQLKLIMLQITVTIIRLKAGQHLEEGGQEKSKHLALSRPGKTEQQLAQQIMTWISDALALPIGINERNFLAQQLEGVNYKPLEHLLIENYDGTFLYQVSELIQAVSEKTANDFRTDSALYYNLVTHIQATFNRPEVSEFQESPHTLLDRITDQYFDLYQAVGTSFSQAFPGQKIGRDELAYIVIHFATSLERHPQGHQQISLLLVCASGMGTTKILENRLKKYIKQNLLIDVVKLSALNQVALTSYDIVLSTLFLPGLSRHYHLVSPLLLDDELKALEIEIEQIAQNKDWVGSNNRTGEVGSLARNNQELSLENYYHKIKEAYQVYQNFQVIKVNNNGKAKLDLKTLLDQQIGQLRGQQVGDSQQVSEAVMRRFKESAIGIPHSSIGLFHTSHVEVLEPYFVIYDLAEGYPILGMDHQMMTLRRLLLLLAPNPLTPWLQEVMGAISSSVIENDANLSLYDRGDEGRLKQLLNNILLTTIKNMDSL